MVEAASLPSILVISKFYALSEPPRMQVINLLRDQKLCVCDLCETLRVSQSKLSFHLKALKQFRLA